ncbi:uncharacterized protein [Clytia hemisphaerica]|uniref:uncharacterized protein n=1 Tax=Clytia hemisphaerica TaxID=252671 RepID=UPI0034D6C6E8
MNIQRTIRSKTLKDALSNFVVTPIIKYCHIISLRCVWDVNEEDLPEASFNIMKKKEEIEAKINEFEDIVMYFSCLCAMESTVLRKELIREDPENSGDDYKDECLIPGISFWIGVVCAQTEVEKIELALKKKIMKAGLDVTTCKPITPRNKTRSNEYYSAALFQTLKDYNRREMIEQACKFYNLKLSEATMKRHKSSLPVDVNVVGEDKVPASLTIRPTIPIDVKMKLLKGMDDIKFTRLAITIVDDSSDRAAVPSKPKPQNKICQAIAEIDRHMKKKGYAICEGMVYKKPKECKFTYVMCSKIKKYLMRCLKITKIAELLTPHIERVTELLSDPDCGLITPMTRLFNVIEVLPHGTCFLITEKRFVKIKKFAPDHTPRTFIRYEYKADRCPYPIPFIQGIFNSFPKQKTRVHFLQKFYQLLLHKMFPIKERKLLLHGKSNSGKTTWFYTLQGLISTEHIAGVTQEGRFAGHMIKDSTEVVFMDEWTSNSLSCEDAKRVLQGGLVMLSQKHKDARKVKYMSGFYITTNKRPKFGTNTNNPNSDSSSSSSSSSSEDENDDNVRRNKDHDAVYNRLRCFKTKPLPVKDSSVATWLRNNCMEVFHYCAEVLKEMPLFESCTNEELFRLKREELRTGAVFNDYDGLVDQLLADSDFESESAGESTSSETTSEAELTFTEHEMDLYFLGADENDPQRWEKKHPLFTTHPDRIDEALYQLRKLSEEEWKKIPINCQDLTRYNIRKANNWDGIDSFYTEWLRRQSAGGSSKTTSTDKRNDKDCPLKRRLQEDGILDQHRSSDSSDLEEALTQPKKKRLKIANSDSNHRF